MNSWVPRLTPLQRVPELRTGRSCSWVTESRLLRRLLSSGFGSQSCVTWSLFTSQTRSPPEMGWLRPAACYSSLFLSSVPSSHLDPVSPHSTLQGSGATTPEHPSVIDPLMEQDEGPGTPPAKQSTPSSRSADACHEPSIRAPWLSGVGPGGHCWGPNTSSEGRGSQRRPALQTAHRLVRIWGGEHASSFFLPPSCPLSLFFSRFLTDSFLALPFFFLSSFSHSLVFWFCP